jgi:endoglucanase
MSALVALHCGGGAGTPEASACSQGSGYELSNPSPDTLHATDAGPCKTTPDAGHPSDAAPHTDAPVTPDAAPPPPHDAGSDAHDAAPPPPPPPPPSGLALHVVGNHLVDANANTVRLLGVDRSGQEFKCIQTGSPGLLGWGIFDGPTDLPSAQAIASWHANAVRIPLNEDCWLGINGVNPLYAGAAYQAAIAGYIATLHQAGLYVIVDLHWNSPGTIPAAAQQALPDADHAVAFWSSVATAFASDPAVVFDLYNEPFVYPSYLENASQDPWDCWLNGCGINQYLTGGTPYTLPYNWSSVGMQALVNTVRGVGAHNVIMIGGLDWANDLSGWLAHKPTDPQNNIAASWHSYPGQGCSDVTCWGAVIAPIAAQVPVVTGETGDNVCSGAPFVSQLLPWANAQGISYLGWTWNTWGDCANILISDYNGTPTTNFGQAYHDALMATHP